MRVALRIPNAEAIDLSADLVSDDTLTVEIARDSTTNTVVRTLTGELTFAGQAFHRLRDLFFNVNADPCAGEVSLEVRPGCCNRVYLFKLSSEAVSIDPVLCEINVTLQSETANQRAYDCLRDRPYWWGTNAAVDEPDRSAGGFIEGYDHARLKYCRAPVDTLALLNLVTALITIVLAIQALDILSTNWPIVLLAVAAVGTGGFIFVSIITNCRRWHIAPYLRDILEYNCQRCGLALQSDVLSSQLYGATAILQAQRERGERGREARDISNWNDLNAPNLNTVELLELVAPAFNADWQIFTDQVTGNPTLRFDPSGSFVATGPVIADLTDEDFVAEATPIYQYDFDGQAAYGVFEYTSDPVDDESSQVQPLFELVQDFRAGSDCRKGPLRVRLDFSVPHTKGDRHDDLEDARGTAGRALDESDLGGVVRDNDLELSSEEIRDISDENTLVLTKHSSAQLKLLRLDTYPGSRQEERFVILDNEQRSNWPFYWSELYPRFYAEANRGGAPILMSDVEWVPDDFCSILEAIETNSLNVRIRTPYGTGNPDRIFIDYARTLIRVSGVRLQQS